MTARPIRHKAQVPDRNGKIFYTSITSLSHISKPSRDASNLNFMITIPIDSSTTSTEWNFSYVFKGDMKEFVTDAPKFVFKATAVKA